MFMMMMLLGFMTYRVQRTKKKHEFECILDSNFRRVLNIVCILLGIGEIPKRIHTTRIRMTWMQGYKDKFNLNPLFSFGDEMGIGKTE
jgi:hypothetical protein